jgi:hypothetical protein
MSSKLWTVLPVLLAGYVIANEPLPDQSEGCLSCQTQVQSMYDTWTNETTVADILDEMKNNCKAYKSVKQEVCDKIAVCVIMNVILG